MSDSINLDEILLNIQNIQESGTINIALLKYHHRKQEENFAITLPGNLNSDFLSDILTSLESFCCDKTSHPFDPVGKSEDDTYEYINLSNIQDQWSYIKELIVDAETYKEKSELAPSASLSITKLSIEGSSFTYHLGKQQTPTEKLLKRNRVLMSSNDKLEDKSNNKVFLFCCDVDFIVQEDKDGNGYVFILDRKNFCKIFNYDEEMKAQAKANVKKIDSWEFLSSPDLIYDKINQKNVYHRLAKIFSDPIYLEQIEKTSPADLKKNLLERSDGKFGGSDFDGNQIKLTNKNLDKVMKMIAKGFRYNFFANKAEES